MNTLLRTLCVSALLTVTSVFAAAPFEGKVSLALSQGGGKAQPITYAMKGQSIRMELATEGQTMASIMDLAKSQMIMLIPAQRMYIVMPIKPPAATARESLEQGGEIKKTGRTDTILGYPCDEYVAQDNGTTTEIWLAQGLGTFMGMGSGNPMLGRGNQSAPRWEEQIKGQAGFPLRVVSKDARGQESFRLETTQIEPSSLPDELFTPPADYEKFMMPDRSNMMGPPR